jgi:hypothetical protein
MPINWNAVATGAGILSDVFGSSKTDLNRGQIQQLEWQNSQRKAQNKVDERRFQQTMRFNERQNLRKHYEWQREIRNRVTDAKAAGIHPLYALGTGGGYSPVSMSAGTSAIPSGAVTGADLSTTDSDILRGIGGVAEFFASEKERKRQRSAANRRDRVDLELKKSQAELNYAEALKAQSEATRLKSRAMTQQDISVGTAETYATGETQKVPAKITTSAPGKPGETAGKEPAWRTYTLNDGTKVYKPNVDDLDLMQVLLGAGKTYVEAWKTTINWARYKAEQQLKSVRRPSRKSQNYAKSRGWTK